MEETYTQAIDVRQYKRSGTHLNLLVVSKKEGSEGMLQNAALL